MDKFERNQIRSILQDTRFHAVEKLIHLTISVYESESTKADDQFNTIWRTAQKEAKVQSLRDLINKLIEEASKADEH